MPFIRHQRFNFTFRYIFYLCRLYMWHIFKSECLIQFLNNNQHALKSWKCRLGQMVAGNMTYEYTKKKILILYRLLLGGFCWPKRKVYRSLKYANNCTLSPSIEMIFYCLYKSYTEKWIFIENMKYMMKAHWSYLMNYTMAWGNNLLKIVFFFTCLWPEYLHLLPVNECV